MFVLGLSCGVAGAGGELCDGWPVSMHHDSAAAFIGGGRLVAAVEEERLNRIKHTNKFAEHAARHVVGAGGIRAREIDAVAYYWEEAALNVDLGLEYGHRPSMPRRTIRELLLERLCTTFDYHFDDDVLVFVNHHLSHATATFAHSGFDNALVLVMDGRGEAESISVYSASGTGLDLVRSYPISCSLGYFYTRGVEMLGYGLFDEYKVMGLAPYGDAARFRDLFASLYCLDADGDFHFHADDVREHFLQAGLRPRQRGEEFGRDHADFAAALQAALEDIVTHVADHARHMTGHRRVCLSGGVALNCTMVGNLLRSTMFDRVFIDPASHDAGAAIGAGLHVDHSSTCAGRSKPLEHVYLGPPLGDHISIARELNRWREAITVHEPADLVQSAAQDLHDGAIIGWCQGRSEFGPRALGNRSILADARPPENKDRVNAVVKKREAYRPFAPAVVAEEAAAFFTLPSQMVCDFMVASVEVVEEARELLGAVTHLDGSARLQVVDRSVNPLFHGLIEEFGLLTGVPVVLNTSFNNHAEPIVDSVHDAVVTFLTTELDVLYVGPFRVEKREDLIDLIRTFSLYLPPHIDLQRQFEGATAPCYLLVSRLSSGSSVTLSETLGRLLERAAGLLELTDVTPPEVLKEVVALWADRFVVLVP